MNDPVEKIGAEIDAAEAVLGYQEPVAQLLTLGDVRELERNYDYLALGLTPDDTPELIRLMQDDDLYWSDSDNEFWASLHAARALGQLRAESAVEALIDNLSRIDDDDEWVMSDYPEIFSQIGPAALPALQENLQDATKGEYQRVFSADAVVRIAGQHPDVRDRCVALLVDQLRLHAEQPEWLNASLINHLVDLGVHEAAPVMAEAFAADHVDLSLMGDWEEAQIRLGLLTERLTPAPGSWLDWPSKAPFTVPQMRKTEQAALRAQQTRQQQAKDHKRKQEKKARKQAKQNKKKKK